ncbi:MAG: aldo/keto reductase [Caldilineaceae bacterium]|nr:aldo/keto reductase [Caldilineaceae bacterium]
MDDSLAAIRDAGPALGLGLAALGRPGYITLGHGDDLGHTYAVTHMAAQTHAVLDAAWAAGVRYFDAARSYGRAEEFLAKWLHSRGIAPAAVTVASKWGYTYTADWQVTAAKHEVKEHSLPVLARQWQESQQLLGAYLGLYQIHSATLESGVLQNQAVLRALAKLKEQGIAIGLSLSGPQQGATLAVALTVAVDGQPLFDAVQATWNLLERSAEAALQAAHAQGLCVIVKETLANGRLTARNQAADFVEQKIVLQAEAKRLGTTMDALALAAVLAQPWVSIGLSGAATVAQLQANLLAARVGWDDEVAQKVQALQEAPAAYWAQRNRLAWN